MAQCNETNDLVIFILNNATSRYGIADNSIVLCKKCVENMENEVPKPPTLNDMQESMILFKANHQYQCPGWCGEH